MDIKNLKQLEKLLVDKLSSLEHPGQKQDENILLTKSVLQFILTLVDERLDKNNNSLIASQEDIDNLSF